MKNTVIIIFNYKKINQTFDIEIPLDITANELIYGLNKGLKLGIQLHKVEDCYLCTENPIALLRGNVLLEEFGVRNGTIINFER